MGDSRDCHEVRVQAPTVSLMDETASGFLEFLTIKVLLHGLAFLNKRK